MDAPVTWTLGDLYHLARVMTLVTWMIVHHPVVLIDHPGLAILFISFIQISSLQCYVTSLGNTEV